MGKLVRDKIPDLIIADGMKPIVIKLSVDEMEGALIAKLSEEFDELLSDLNIEEIIDMMEVLFAMAKKLGFSESETLKARSDKRASKGGFDHRLFLDGIISVCDENE